jgi:hypothetical protein
MSAARILDQLRRYLVKLVVVRLGQGLELGLGELIRCAPVKTSQTASAKGLKLRQQIFLLSHQQAFLRQTVQSVVFFL